ncbi:UNVERIFIED_CONTAM: hypothetical protein H355_013030, partial [Colinus virginianus]
GGFFLRGKPSEGIRWSRLLASLSLTLFSFNRKKMSLKSERRGIHVDQSELLCKKGCGYYGNPAWQGFCSKCWREEYHKARQKQIQEDWELAERLQREEEEAYASSQSTQGAQSLTFSKFEEKKTNEKTRKVTTVKKFFTASSRTGAKKVAQEKVVKQGQLGRERNADNILRDLKEIFTPSWELASPAEAEIQEAKAPSPSINRQASIETDRVSKEFIEFLKTYHKPGQDIYKQCKLFLDTMNHKREPASVFECNVANINTSGEDIFAFSDCYCSWTRAIKSIAAISSTRAHLISVLLQDLSIEEQSECAQDFYQNVAEKLQTRWKGAEDLEELTGFILKDFFKKNRIGGAECMCFIVNLCFYLGCCYSVFPATKSRNTPSLSTQEPLYDLSQ